MSTYHVTAIRKSNNAKKMVKVASNVRTAKITGLKRNATYVFRVYAKNAAGSGAVSNKSNTVTAR